VVKECGIIVCKRREKKVLEREIVLGCGCADGPGDTRTENNAGTGPD
jgi:hypothetical protein